MCYLNKFYLKIRFRRYGNMNQTHNNQMNSKFAKVKFNISSFPHLYFYLVALPVQYCLKGCFKKEFMHEFQPPYEP